MDRKLVKQLKPGDRVKDTFAVIRKSLAAYSPQSQRSGEKYLRLQVGDSSGVIEARLWDNVDRFAHSFDVDDLIYVEGQVVDYMGPQLNISFLEKRSPKDVDISLYQATSRRDRKDMIETLLEVVGGMKNADLKRLLEVLFDEEGFLDAFSRAPGGMRVHHACSGGLLEHTLEVVNLAHHLYEMHPDTMNRDVLTTGAILHDVGKIEEYDLDSLSFRLTDKGKLIGHVVMGKEIFERAVARAGNFPGSLQMEIGHIILSHHGQREWGSPEVPKTIHAFALFHADLVSARINQFATLLRCHQDPGVSWTSWDKYLERSAYINQDLDGLHNDAS